MYIAQINITLKESVLDPQGQTVMKALNGMGETQVKDVRVGKYVELQLNETSQSDAEKSATRICEKLLVNSVIESYRLSIVQA
ncbi:phosphoribosylformylglycinamidine synthase subunit PurS [Leptospira sp. GIMC2001]|uniref:phosphoribosylformylglycinamidine synthase subunit PurS n=1 Tax=Leptospira sp. GIMC2001 TaxID=1513297 RepID=UPI00234ABF0C|nr:phosphoribosylformylglycinamidine synthase subunit PurS [Leptospira sp. GIMC2001]WCL51126.1 phosphoribosylformylglycinamidine synthase subunit PurS [Leptospira sp. GIMC2001]